MLDLWQNDAQATAPPQPNEAPDVPADFGDRFAGEWDQAAPQLAGALGQQLLEPGAEIGDSFRGYDCDFVALKARRCDA